MSYSLYQSYEERQIYCACDPRPVFDVDIRDVLRGALYEVLGDDGRHVQLRLRCHSCCEDVEACIEVIRA